MPTPVGPLFAAGTTEITKSGYKISFLPDAHNDELQRAGQPPIYYWPPNEVRLAQKDNGDFRFSMIHFVGVRSASTTVGATGTEEVAGGVVTFATTAAPPGEVLREAQNELLDKLRGNNDHFWGLRTNVAPMFRFAPIVSNITSVSNLGDMGGDGGIPAPSPNRAIGGPPRIRSVPVWLPAGNQPRTVPRNYRGTNLDPMMIRMTGQGSGSINPDAINAYSALLGAIPAAILYNSFHMATGSLTVKQDMLIRVVSPQMTISIDGDWSHVQTHLSGAAHAGGLFWAADLKAQYDSMRQSGDIEVKTFVDTSLPNADKLQEYMDKRTDMIFQKFMELMKQAIFDPAPFQEPPAQASSGLFGLFGGGAAFKLRQQRISGSIGYHETREMAYTQLYPVGGTMDGLYDVLKADPAAEKKYFLNVDIGEWDRKVSRIVKPVVNWPDPAQQWVGQPVAFLSAQIGYPNAKGELQWDGHVFGPNDPPGAQWNTATAMKKKEDVENPPQGWEPDKTFVKRTIHFTEPPSALENPFARVQVEKNEVDLDEGDLGTPMNDITLAVRVDEAGTLAVGPLMLGAVLDAPSQVVEVTFRAKGNRQDGKPREPVKFTWTAADQDKSRFWLLYTGDSKFEQHYEYQVHVLVKGSLFHAGQEWTGPWTDGMASGSLTVSVPTPDSPGVTKKDLPLWAIGADGTPTSQPAPVPPPYSGSHPVAPPTGGSPAPPGTRGVPATVSGWSYGRPPTDNRQTQNGSADQRDEVVFSGFEPASDT
jgi:hypothetical protein